MSNQDCGKNNTIVARKCVQHTTMIKRQINGQTVTTSGGSLLQQTTTQQRQPASQCITSAAIVVAASYFTAKFTVN